MKTLLSLTIATLALLFGGCATPSNPAAMIPAKVELAKKHTQTLSLNVTGGRGTSAAGASQISSEDFTTALRAAIEQSELFSKVLDVNTSDYHLEVLIASIDQPMFGFDMKVTLETNWTLTRKSDGKIVWQKAIPSVYTATTGDAFAGVKRLRMANEGAARKNIEQALKDISALTL